jgi:uncharacterized protein YuzE
LIRQSYDLAANALYITVTDRQVTHTVEVDPGTLVDVDAAGSIVGIEVLNPDRCWPLNDILDRFSTGPEDAAQLKAFFSQPSQLSLPEHPATPRVLVTV